MRRRWRHDHHGHWPLRPAGVPRRSLAAAAISGTAKVALGVNLKSTGSYGPEVLSLIRIWGKVQTEHNLNDARVGGPDVKS